MKFRNFLSFCALTPVFALGLAATIQYTQAQTSGTWITNGPGNWSNTANWSGGTVAGGAGATADFSTLNITADNTVTLDTAVTLGTLSVQDATTASNSWTFAGTNTLTLDNGASQPVLNILNRFPVIAVPLAGTNGFSKPGAGQVTLSGDNSGLSGTIDLPNVTGTNSAGLNLVNNTAIGNVTAINIGGTATTGQHLALTGEITLGPAVTINLNSQGGNSAPSGAIRAEGNATNIVTIQGPVNVTLAGNASRIANNSAKRLDITGKIDGGANGVTFRVGKNEGIHITNTANTWSGQTVHSQETLWFEPGSLPTTTNLQLCASGAGTVQTSGTFTRALGSAANQVQFAAYQATPWAQGFGARGGALTLNFGGAGADILFDTTATAAASRIRANTLVLNGATADSNITLVNPIDINGAARTIQVSSQTATLQGGIKGGTFNVTKTSTGTLEIAGASTWLGELINNNAKTVRISHSQALGAPATAKIIRMQGQNRSSSVLELAGGITVDANKTLNISGKSFYSNAETAVGTQYSMRNLSGNNAWLGNIMIAETGGAYGIECAADTLTLGADPSTTSVIQNTAAASSIRPMSFFGSGNFVVNSKIADNGTYDTGINHVGSGLLSLTRADNDFDQVPNLWSGTTQVVKMSDSLAASSLGTASGINLGGTLRYTGLGDTSNRSIGLLQRGATIDSSGTGPLSLTSSSMTHHAGSTTVLCAPFAAGVTVLTVDNAAGMVVGQTVTGTNIAAGSTITAIDVGTRQVTLSAATTAASASGYGTILTIGGAATLNRTLTLTGSNTGDNTFAASLSDPGTGKLAITKTGAGKWILSGATKTNTGALDVQEGTLGISGPMPAGTVTVAAAATLSLDNTTLSGAPALSIAGTLNLAGPVSVNLSSVTTPGTYTAMEYGALTGTGTLTASYRGATFDTTTSPTSTSLTVGAGMPLTWTGSGTSTWDVMTTPNWIDGSLNPQSFYFLDSVTFDETGALQPIVTLAAEVRPLGITVNNPTTDYTLSGPGFISGSGGLVKSGAASLTLATANTFSGGIQLNAGTLKVGDSRALGANGQIVTIASGAMLDTSGLLTVSRDYEAVISGKGIGDIGAIVNSGADHQAGFKSLTLAADATIGGTGRWDVRPVTAGTTSVNLDTHTLTKIGTNIIAMVDGAITGDGSIDVNEGMLSLTRLTVTGGGSINVNYPGILRFENNTSGYYAKAIKLNGTATDAAVTQLTGSNLTLDAPITLTNTGNIHVAFTRTFVAAQPIDGTGSLKFTSSGTGAVGVLALQAENTYAGATTVDTGTLRIGNRTATGSINTLPVTLSTNGNLQIARSDAYVFPNVIEGTGSVLIGANAAVTAPEYDSLVTLTGANTFSGNVTVYSGGLKIQNIAALGTGTKTVTLTNGTNGRPQFYLDGSAGNITLSSDFSFVTSSQDLTHPAIGNLAGDNVIEGTLALTSGGGNTTVSVLGGTLALNGGISNPTTTNRELILAGNAGTTGTVNGLISNGADAFRVSKSQEGTWKLTAANTYTGTTTVNAGTLLINGIQNLATGNVTVNGGALGGTGTIGGNITVNAAGTIAPGASVGTLTTVNSVTVDGTLSVEIDGTSADKLIVGSTLDVSGATLTVSPVGAGLTEPVYIIAEVGAPIVGDFATVNVPGYTVEVNYNGLNQIALVAGTPYGNWETANGIAGAGATADSDGDGIANGIEFVIGGDPSGPGSASNALMPTVTTDATYLNFVFRRSDVSAEYHPFVQYGTDLTGWTAAQNGTNGVIITEENDPFPGEPGIDRVTVRIPRALAAPGSQLFARLRVEIP
ncbi:MAG: autotransporter-associated beta strand repeat-containing protein [Verrucomicrobia bacterium]|nr:autotransporter-associated beta strand repeat-containing protein [Verrucomicrobiota bacterium]